MSQITEIAAYFSIAASVSLITYYGIQLIAKQAKPSSAVFNGTIKGTGALF